jgi:AraC family transcriptional regulator
MLDSAVETEHSHRTGGTLGQIIGVAEQLASSSTAIVNLTALRPSSRLPDHTHTNPYLLLHVLGRYCDEGDDGIYEIGGPAAVFHPAGSAHEMAMGAQGLATVIIEFDPDWLRRIPGSARTFDRARKWLGGPIGGRATGLARAWLHRPTDKRLFPATENFLASLVAREAIAEGPAWTAGVHSALKADEPPALDSLARQVGVSRLWLVRAYRDRYGEGIAETLRRQRVERAICLIEGSNLSLAAVAAEAGFCDQSHMNRAIKLLLGMTPNEVRSRHLGLASSPGS